MGALHLKFHLKQFSMIRARIYELQLYDHYIYHKASQYGHIRIETAKDHTAIFKNMVLSSHFSNTPFNSLHILFRLKHFVGFNFHQKALPGLINDIETLLLYEIFDLFGFYSKSLFFGYSGQNIFLSHHQLSSLNYVSELMTNFAQEKNIQKMTGSL